MNLFGAWKRESLPSSGRETAFEDKDYNGEWYVPSLSPEEFTDYRTHEKAYSMIAVILQVIIGFIPAMGLNAPLPAGFYILTLIVLIRQAWIAYHSPEELSPLSYDQYSGFGRKPRLYCLISRVLVMGTAICDALAVWKYGLGFSIWVILQLAILLANAFVLQKLYLLQRSLSFDAVTGKPEN